MAKIYRLLAGLSICILLVAAATAPAAAAMPDLFPSHRIWALALLGVGLLLLILALVLRARR